MYRWRTSLEVIAPPARVWRALCKPDEVKLWDSGVIEALDAPVDYPLPGQIVHWRCRSGWWRQLEDRPQEVIEGRRLRSLLRLGPQRMDETYALAATDDGSRLTLEVELQVRLPLGWIIEKLWAGAAMQKSFELSLTQLKAYCETRSDGEVD